MESRINPDWVFCQILMRRADAGFDLRHELDRDEDCGKLKRLRIADLRALAQTTATGAFRPLKSAPNLPRGWQAHARSIPELADALEYLYPGGMADWLAAQSERPPVTSYREFTNRQTGMYRTTTFLDDHQAAIMARACCDRRFCLKRRLWTVGDLEADEAESKTILPCLEPCAVLLEFARKIARFEQDESTPAVLASANSDDLHTKLHELLKHGLKSDQREADFGDPNNPRILLWKLLKLGRET